MIKLRLRRMKKRCVGEGTNKSHVESRSIPRSIYRETRATILRLSVSLLFFLHFTLDCLRGLGSSSKRQKEMSAYRSKPENMMEK